MIENMKRGVYYMKKFIPRHLWSRFLLIVIAPMLLIQIVSITSFYYTHWMRVSRQLSANVASNISFASELINKTPEDSHKLLLAMARIEWYSNIHLDLKAKALSKVDPTLKMWRYDTLNDALKSKLSYKYQYYLNEPGGKVITIEVLLPSGLLTYIIRQKSITSVTVGNYIGLISLSSLILSCISLLFLMRQIRPISNLARASSTFSRNYNATYVRPEGALEVKQAINSFNRMSKRISSFIEQRMLLLSGVSHDIRTPLTRMKLGLEMADDTSEIEDLKNDVKEMETMLEGYLSFARGTNSEPAKLKNINDFIEDITTNFSRHGFHIQYDSSSTARLWIRETAMKRAVSNVLTNAQRYATEAVIVFKRDYDNFFIEVHDNGQGIPSEELQNVFKPFYRIEDSRNRSTGGSGLGLSIVRDMAKSHGGDVNLFQSTKLSGLCVQIQLPLDLQDGTQNDTEE